MDSTTFVIGGVGSIGFLIGVTVAALFPVRFQVTHVVRLVRCVCVSGGQLPANFGRGIVLRFLGHAAEEELLDVHHIRGLGFPSGFVGHGISLSDFPIVLPVPSWDPFLISPRVFGCQ